MRNKKNTCSVIQTIKVCEAVLDLLGLSVWGQPMYALPGVSPHSMVPGSVIRGNWRILNTLLRWKSWRVKEKWQTATPGKYVGSLLSPIIETMEGVASLHFWFLAYQSGSHEARQTFLVPEDWVGIFSLVYVWLWINIIHNLGKN